MYKQRWSWNKTDEKNKRTEMTRRSEEGLAVESDDVSGLKAN